MTSVDFDGGAFDAVYRAQQREMAGGIYRHLGTQQLVQGLRARGIRIAAHHAAGRIVVGVNTAVQVQRNQTIHHAVQNGLAVAACFFNGLAVLLYLPVIEVVLNRQAQQIGTPACGLKFRV